MSLNVKPAEIVERAVQSGSPGLLAAAPGWPRVPLGSLIKVVNGAAFPSRQFNTDGRGMPLVRIRDVGADQPRTYFEGPYDKTHLVNAGDLLVGMDGDFRVARWRGPQSLLNQRVCRLDITTADLAPGWLEHTLQGYLDAIWRETSSITVKHLSSRSIADIPLPFPSVAEQRRIIDLLEGHLSRLAAANAYLNACGRRLRSLRSSWAQAHLHPGGVADVLTIGELAQDIRGGWSRSRTHLTLDETVGVPYVKMNNIKNDGGLDLTDVHLVRGEPRDIDRYRIRAGDVLFNSKNSAELVGKVGVVPERATGWTYNENIMRIRFAESVLPEFAALVMSSPRFRREVRRDLSASTNVAAIYMRQLRAIPIWVPTRRTQERLVEEHEILVHAESGLRQSMASTAQRTGQLRYALLHAAFSGRLSEAALVTEIGRR